jgi:hypothetical protein
MLGATIKEVARFAATRADAGPRRLSSTYTTSTLYLRAYARFNVEWYQNVFMSNFELFSSQFEA